jgi:hypothetical protein
MHAPAVLHRLYLPRNLLTLIREGTLLDEIERAYAEYDELNRRTDAWERQHPERAAAVDWAPTRQAWKDAGRPRPPWYELLWSREVLPMDSWDMQAMLVNSGAQYKRAEGASRAAKAD